MKREQLFEAIGMVSDKYIEKNTTVCTRRSLWLRVGAAAACVAVLATTLLLQPWHQAETGDTHMKDGYEDADAITPGVSQTPADAFENSQGVNIPQATVTLGGYKDAEFCMVGFFIYEGRSYVFEDITESEDIVGNYLGTATGLIDEWTTEDGYVDFAGSVKGDFYSVKGYDTSFMLCMHRGDGGVELYVNNNDITLTKGSEVFEDRLHLGGRVSLATTQTRYDWYYSTGLCSPLTDLDALERFLNALNDAPFLAESDVPLPEGASNIFDGLETYHIFLTLTDGIPVHLRLFKGGYVQYNGIRAVVKVPEAEFNAFTALLS